MIYFRENFTTAVVESDNSGNVVWTLNQWTIFLKRAGTNCSSLVETLFIALFKEKMILIKSATSFKQTSDPAAIIETFISGAVKQ